LFFNKLFDYITLFAIKTFSFINLLQDLSLQEAETIAVSILKQVMEEKVQILQSKTVNRSSCSI